MVVECSCGMVMSVSTESPRAYCIRCGGIEFHVVGNLAAALSRSDVAGNRRVSSERAGPPAFESLCYAIVACISDGSDI